MTIVMSFRQWRHYLENVLKIEVWSDHANLKQFMSQTVLNSCQAHWLIQLISYDFIIQYHQDSLNSADKSSQRLNYIVKLSKEHEDSMSEQIDDLILILVNKLATVILIKTGRQYSYQVRNTDSETEDLIQVLSLQMITWLKIRLTADNLELYKKTNDLDYKETNDLNFRETKSSILNQTLKSLTCCADKYLVNFMKNQKETSHLLWSEMKFWERWIMFLCLSRRLFESDS